MGNCKMNTPTFLDFNHSKLIDFVKNKTKKTNGFVLKNPHEKSEPRALSLFDSFRKKHTYSNNLCQVRFQPLNMMYHVLCAFSLITGNWIRFYLVIILMQDQVFFQDVKKQYYSDLIY